MEKRKSLVRRTSVAGVRWTCGGVRVAGLEHLPIRIRDEGSVNSDRSGTRNQRQRRSEGEEG